MKTSRQINAERNAGGLPPLNFALFRKVIKKLEAAPEAYNQNTWGQKSDIAPCGTAACIAGWAAHLSGKVTIEELHRRTTSIRDIAGSQLGLNAHEWQQDERDVLFGSTPAHDWPEPFRTQWHNAASRRGQARVAIRYLKRIIKTGKVLE